MPSGMRANIPLEARASTVTGPRESTRGSSSSCETSRKGSASRPSGEPREELERRIEERTAALKESQERLRQVEKMERSGRLAAGLPTISTTC